MMLLFVITGLLLLTSKSGCAMEATVTLYGANTTTSYGVLKFTQDSMNASVRITGTITGLNVSSAHGFHVHELAVSDGSPNCGGAGPHFNPYNKTHGPKAASISNRHVGDLGNLTTDANGRVDVNMEDSIIQLYSGVQSIMNRTVIIHLFRDDGGFGGFPDSSTTGNAGARIICGLIKASNAVHIKPAIFTVFLLILIIFTN